MTSDDANATDGVLHMHGDGRTVSDAKFRHARASRVSLQQKIGIPSDLGDELTNNLSKAAQELHRKARLSVTKNGFARATLQARTPHLAHDAFIKTKEVMQNEVTESALSLRSFSLPLLLLSPPSLPASHPFSDLLHLPGTGQPETEMKKPLNRRLSFPSVVDYDELRPDEIEGLITRESGAGSAPHSPPP